MALCPCMVGTQKELVAPASGRENPWSQELQTVWEEEGKWAT